MGPSLDYSLTCLKEKYRFFQTSVGTLKSPMGPSLTHSLDWKKEKYRFFLSSNRRNNMVY